MWNEFTLLYSEEVSFTFNYSIGYFYLNSKLYSSETYFFNVVAISWAIFLIRYDSLVHITHHLEKKKTVLIIYVFSLDLSILLEKCYYNVMGCIVHPHKPWLGEGDSGWCGV